MEIEIDSATVNDSYCVYSHIAKRADGQYETFYVGVCHLRLVFNYPDARRNVEWQSIRRIHPRFTIRIEYVHNNLDECLSFAAMMIVVNNPIVNATPTPVQSTSRSRRVTCLTTSRSYRNAQDAAQQNNISISAMSNHLNRRHGYATIRNLIFVRED